MSGRVQLALALLVAVALGVAWCWHSAECREAALAREQLVQTMQESISARRGPLDRVRVALFDATGRCENGLEELTAILDSTDECSWHLVSSSEIRSGVLSQHDVVVVPGGRARRQAEALGSQGREAVPRVRA